MRKNRTKLQFNKKRYGTLLIAIFIVSMLFTFSSLINNVQANQNDNDTEVTLHGHMDSSSNEISSELMPIGTYTYYQTPELDVGDFNHDLTRIDVSELQYPTQNITSINNFGLKYGTNTTSGNKTLLYKTLPSYDISATFDTIITFYDNFSFSNYSKPVYWNYTASGGGVKIKDLCVFNATDLTIDLGVNIHIQDTVMTYYVVYDVEYYLLSENSSGEWWEPSGDHFELIGYKTGLYYRDDDQYDSLPTYILDTYSIIPNAMETNITMKVKINYAIDDVIPLYISQISGSFDLHFDYKTIPDVYVSNFNYQILGIDYYYSGKLVEYISQRIINNNGTGSFVHYFSSALFTQYNDTSTLHILTQNITFLIDVRDGLNENASFSIKIGYTSSVWKVPSEVDIKINGNDVNDDTYNTGYVYIANYFTTITITADIVVYFKLVVVSQFSFSFDLDVVSRTYLRKSFELLSDHNIWLSQIVFSDNLNIKYIDFNDQYLGSLNPTNLSPEISMDTGNEYYLNVLLYDEIYIPLQYFRNNLGTGASDLDISATSNSFQYADLTRFDTINVIMPNQWETEQALLQFSNIYYTPNYAYNDSYNLNGEYAESTSVSDVDVSWDPEYYLTPSNATKLGEYDADAGMVATMSPVPDNFTLLNGTNIYYDDMNVMDGVYTDFRSTQENSSAIPIYYQFLNGSLVSSGSLWKTDGSYSDFKSTTGVSGSTVDTGWLFPGTAENVDLDGKKEWTNPNNAKTADGNGADMSLTSVTYGDYLKLTNFGIAVPAGATITGIQVQIYHKRTFSDIKDNIVKLVRDGTIEGTNNASPTQWVGGTWEMFTYGNSTYLWGLTWSVAQANSANTGVVLSPKCTNTNGWAYVDYMNIKFYYQFPASAGALNFTSTLQINKPINSQIESARLIYAQKINTTITAGIRTMYAWNFATSSWDAINTTITSQNYFEMIYSLTSNNYNSTNHIKLKWIITRTDSIDAFSLFIDKCLVRFNYSCVLNFTSTFQFTNSFLDYVNGMELNYAQKTNSTVNVKGFYIWNFDLNQWYCVNNTISSTTFYDICFTLNSSFYNASNYIKLKWILSKSNANSRYSLYIDELLLTVWFTVNDDEYDTVSSLWITDTIVYAHQPINIYFQSYDNLPNIVEISEKVNVGSPSLIFTIPIVNNTLQSLNYINETSGQYFLNFTFYDDFNNWEMWTLNFTLHSSVSINLAYPNPTFVNKYSNVSFYIKSTTEIISIHYDNSTDWLLRAESYPITETNFTFILYHASAQSFNISVIAINAYSDKWWCNVSYLTCIKNAIYIDILNLHSRYYQTDLFNVTVFMRDIVNDPINQVVQYSLDYQDWANIMNGGVMANSYTPIQLSLGYVMDCGYYHLNCSYISSVYLNYWKLMSFDLCPTRRLNTSLDVSLTVNGISVVNNTILMNYSHIYSFTSLDNITFDLDVVMYLNHTETKAYSSYLIYNFDFQATNKITDLTITNATITDYPINFTCLYINGLISSSYTKTGIVLIIDEILSDMMLDDNSYTIYLTYIDNNPTRTQLTVNPTTDDTSVEFKEYLYANRTFSYWYFVNSLELNDMELEHLRTGTTISTFDVNGSMYYFIESSQSGDIYEATVDYDPNWIMTYSYTTTGITATVTIRYKADLDVSNVTILLDLSGDNLWMDSWNRNATEDNTTFVLSVPFVNFTDSYQTVTISGISTVPRCSIYDYISQGIVSINSANDTVYYGFIDYQMFSQYWVLSGIQSDWVLDGVHYGYTTMTINKNTGYFRCSGFDDSITESYLKFKTNPIDDYYTTDDKNGTLTIVIDCNLPVENAMLTFSIPTNDRYRLKSQLENLTRVSDVLGYDIYFFMTSNLKNGINKIEIKYQIYSVSNIWMLLVILALFSVGIIGLYYYARRREFNEMLKTLNEKQRVKYLEAQYKKGGILTQTYREVKEMLRKKTPEEKEQLRKQKEREKYLKEIAKQKILI